MQQWFPAKYGRVAHLCTRYAVKYFFLFDQYYLFQQVVHFFFTWKLFFSDINKNNELTFLFVSQEEKPSYPPRLFQCSNASGAFRVEEIFEFCQEVNMSICFLLRFHITFIYLALMISVAWFSWRTLLRTMLCSWTPMMRYSSKELMFSAEVSKKVTEKGAFLYPS